MWTQRDEFHEQFPHDRPVRLVGGLTEMHELAHSFRVGEADDDPQPLPCGEIYSGDRSDNSEETLVIRGQRRSDWSIMRSGYEAQTLLSRTFTSGNCTGE